MLILSVFASTSKGGLIDLVQFFEVIMELSMQRFMSPKVILFCHQNVEVVVLGKDHWLQCEEWSTTLGPCFISFKQFICKIVHYFCGAV